MPFDWQTASDTLRAMRDDAGPIGDDYPRSFIGIALPFFMGAIPGWFSMHGLLKADVAIPVGLIGAILAFAGLLVGFLATMMLFTGRIDDTPDATYEVVSAHVTRVKYLLISQGVTLLISLCMALVAMAWMLLYAVKANEFVLTTIGSILCGFAMLCLVRSLLLPLQIYELHENWLGALLHRKRASTNAAYEKQNK
ncbi:hypothetical protein GCM10007863_27110 [Dyella mobilis]|nr:hypothetical protein GCM10007863_27110 [Dyella mobilis]